MKNENVFISKAIKAIGSQSKLADSLGVTQAFISQLKRNARPVPAMVCVDIQNLTKGEVKASELRPDVFKAILYP